MTDTKTNQYWTGSANAGPEDLTSVEVTFSPKDGSTVFTNTEYFVNVAYAPSDLTVNLGISGGMTFAGGATSEKMTSDSEQVDFYGPNVYSSGGPGSGDLTATVTPPAGGGNTANGPQAAASSGGLSGGSLNFKLPLDTFNFSTVYEAGDKLITSALVSAASVMMQDIEQNTNTFLLAQENSGSVAVADAARQEWMYLNQSPGDGYITLGKNLSSLLDGVATTSSTANSAGDYVLNLANGTNIEMPGFPSSAVKQLSVSPSLSLSLSYPYINSAGQWQPPKLGDLLLNFGINGKGPIHDDTIVPINGYWTASVSASLSPGHNFQLSQGIKTKLAAYVNLFNNKPVFLGIQASATATPGDGSLKPPLLASVQFVFAVGVP